MGQISLQINNLKRKGVPLTYAALSTHDCMAGWHRTSKPTWLFKDRTGLIAPQEVSVRHELPDGDALLNACLSGSGLAQFPTWLAGDALRQGMLMQVLADVTGGSMPIHVLWQKTWQLQPKVRIAVDTLLNLAKNNPAIFDAK